MTAAGFEFDATLVEWRGPAPYFFLQVPEEESADIKFAARGMEYWGQVAVTVTVDATEFSTALFPREGRYLIPVRAAVRRPLGLELGDTVPIRLRLGRD